jgi:putative nonproteinogenic amino acid hydroxylase
MKSDRQSLGSTCLTTVDVDNAAIRTDLDTIDRLTAARDTYPELHFGHWHTYALANATGDEKDDEFKPQSGPAVWTPLGRGLPGLLGLLEDNFDLTQLRWVRIITQRDSLLVPHVDFIEFDRATTRLQIPLRTSANCLHSEGETVMNLRAGEVWFLDASAPHAACTPAGPTRIALSLDFDVPRAEMTNCLLQQAQPAIPPGFVDRPALADDQLEALIDLGAILDHSTVRDVFRLFGMVHFRRQANAAACFDWFVAAAERSENGNLVQRAKDFRRYCLHERAYREHFAW